MSHGEIDLRMADIVAMTTGIAIHNYVDVPLIAGDVPGPHINLSGEMRRFTSPPRYTTDGTSP